MLPRDVLLDGETVELDRVPACFRRILATMPLRVRAHPIQPEHVGSAPVADDGGHASLERLRKLGHSAAPALGLDADVAHIVAEADGNGAGTARLRQLHLHRPEIAVLVSWEGDVHLKGLRRVDAPGARAVLICAPVPGPIPAFAATAIATDHALLVRGGMEGRMPGVKVPLLHVNLGARLAAHIVCVTVVVPALRLVCVLPHRGEVQGCIATALRLGEVRSVAQRLPEEIEACVHVVIVDAWCAHLRKVGSATHVRYDLASSFHSHLVVPIEIVPPCGHDRDRAMAAHVDHARAHAPGGPGDHHCQEDQRQAPGRTHSVCR
mmetsp:Transcript_118008/g.252037  ORF Transcript_118008/g.252037 Transcript_118008/m.252037 type:complete len:322 (+) Transcript_118008:1131-2096(+)